MRCIKSEAHILRVTVYARWSARYACATSAWVREGGTMVHSAPPGADAWAPAWFIWVRTWAWTSAVGGAANWTKACTLYASSAPPRLWMGEVRTGTGTTAVGIELMSS